MNRKNVLNFKKNNSKKFVFLTVALWCCGIMIVNPQISSRGIKLGIEYCLNLIIPSLFPFMIITSFISKFELKGFFKKVCSWLTKRLFYLPECTAPIIFLSFVAGYPTGAVGAKTLFEKKKINSEQLNRMMCFCVNSGPAFMISAVGSALLNNKKLGLIMLLCQMFSSFLIGIACALTARKHKKFSENKSPANSLNENYKASKLFIDCVSDSSRSLFDICALLTTFSCFVSFIKSVKIPSFIFEFMLKTQISPEMIKFAAISFLEITSGSVYASKAFVSPALISAAAAFGGLCTHAQIISVLQTEKFNYFKFFGFRIIHGVCSGILTLISLKIFSNHIPACSQKSDFLCQTSSATIYPSICLVGLCAYFIFTADFKIFRRNKCLYTEKSPKAKL